MKYLNQSLAFVLSLLIAIPAFPQASVVNQQSQDVNYILNGGFENSKAGWVAYKNTAQATPVTGTGTGAATTIASSTSAPIQGKSSGILTKTAANTQGEGISYAFTLDSAAKGRVLTISALYQIISGTYSGGTSSTDSDVEVYIYDVDAAQVIQPAAYKLDGGVSGLNYTINATFQTNLTSSNYRLIFHEATTSASAYSLKLDQIKLGVGNKSQGPPVTDFIPGSCTSSWTTNTTLACQYKRDGSDAIIEWSLSLSNSPNAASLTFSAPAGLSFDTSKMPTYGASSYYIDGHANANGPAGSSFTIKPIFLAANSVSIYYQSDTAAHDNPVSQTTPVAWGTSMYITARIRVPIQGWSSTVTMSDSADTRVVAFSAQVASAQSILNSANPVTFATKLTDTHGGWNGSTVYTIPSPGYYDVCVHGWTVPAAGATNATIFPTVVAGVVSQSFDQALIATGQHYNVSGCLNGVFLSAGQTATTSFIQNQSGGSVTFTGTFSVVKRSGPSQIAASESVNARYTNTAGTSVPSSATTQIPFGTKDYDSHGAWNGSAYICPVAGKYKVNGIVQINSGSYIAGSQAVAIIYKNGAIHSYGPFFITGSSFASSTVGMSATTTFSCVVGDSIDFRISHGSNVAGSPALNTFPGTNHIEIERVGN